MIKNMTLLAHTYAAEIASVSRSGIKIDYEKQFYETGFIRWTFTYKLKGKKLKLKSGTAKAASMFTTENDYTGYGRYFEKNQYILDRAKTFYASISLKKASFTA